MPALATVVFRFIDTAETGDMSVGRVDVWLKAFSMFGKHSLVGIGWGQYVNQGGWFWNIHNIYIQLLVETGIIGFIIYCGWFLFHLVRTWSMYSKMRVNPEDYTNIDYCLMNFSLAMQIFFILYGFTGNPLYDREMFVPYFIAFQMILDEKQRERAKGSKYMQSKPGDIYQKAYRWLMDNPKKELLFVGMGCQSDGFRKFSEIKGIRDWVHIVDIICHGSPSPKLWREYAESIQKKDGKITYLTFKDKRNGWKSPTAYVKVNGSERPLKDYVRVFYNQCALRPSCYECPYATTERKTDMTIGDFWHIEETIPDFYDPNGNSLFLIHTDRGEELFEKVRDNLDYRLSNTAQCWQANLEAPTQKSEQRDVFWNDYQKKGIDFVIKKYGTVPMKTKVKNKLLKILRGGGTN